MTAYSFDFRDQLNAPWDTARPALIDQLDRLYAQLNVVTPALDYQTGTWIPSLGGTATWQTRAATWTKIGRLVTASADLTVGTIGTGAPGNLSGLPFVPLKQYAGTVATWTSAASTFVFVSCYAFIDSNVYFSGLTAASATVSTPCALFGDGTTVSFQVTYETAA